MERTGFSINKADQLGEILFQKGTEGMSFYDAASKAVFHRENFTAVLQGRDQDVHPVSAEVVPSLECNFQCPDCTYTQNQSKERSKNSRRFMSDETFDKIIKQSKNLGIKSIIFTGGGEPFVHPRTTRYIEQALKEGYEVGVYTNGFNLNDKKISALVGLNPSFIRVSLNGPDALTHSEMFGYSNRASRIVAEKTFDKVVQNIENLGREKLRQGASITIGIGFILGRQNLHSLDKFANTLRQIYINSKGGVDYAAFRPKVKYFDQGLKSPELQPDADVFRFLGEQIDIEITDKLKDLPMQLIVGKDGFRTLSLPFETSANVAAPWSVSFDYDGGLYVSSEHNGSQGYSAGNINSVELQKIWDSQLRKELTGKLQTLPYFKLKTLNDMLLAVKKLGRFSSGEVQTFYDKTANVKPPTHVNFI